MRPLSEASLAKAVRALAARHTDLARLYDQNGVPPLWRRPAGFETLLRIILEQQVSLTSAAAVYERLCRHVAPLTPLKVLDTGSPRLRQLGLTRQKSAFFVNLATAVRDRRLDFEYVERADDAEAQEMLMSVKGIGPWSAKIYLLMVLCRPDVWPTGDIALATAVMELRNLEHRPAAPQLQAIAESWRPYRAVAARLLWHDYLRRRGRMSPAGGECRG